MLGSLDAALSLEGGGNELFALKGFRPSGRKKQYDRKQPRIDLRIALLRCSLGPQEFQQRKGLFGRWRLLSRKPCVDGLSGGSQRLGEFRLAPILLVAPPFSPCEQCLSSVPHFFERSVMYILTVSRENALLMA
jgi:hypothetical protein